MKYPLIAIAGLMMVVGIDTIGQGTGIPAATAPSSSSLSAASADAIPKLQERNPRYRLRKGDSVDLDFALSPEFNQTVAVQPDGYVTLKGVGSLFVEDQTIPQLTETVRTAYVNILHHPVIAVALKDFEKPYFIAAGQVVKPGRYDLRSALTVTQAVAIAGGFNEKAKHSQVVLFRMVPGGMFETKLLNVKKLLASHNLSEDIHLQPGDMLYVPQSAFSRIRPYIPSTGMGAYVNPLAY